MAKNVTSVKLNVEGDRKKEYQYVEHLLTHVGSQLLFSINTPTSKLDTGLVDGTFDSIPNFRNHDVAEMILGGGLRGDWETTVYGVELSFPLMSIMKELWLESVMREYHYKFLSGNAEIKRNSLTEANNLRKLSTMQNISSTSLNHLLKNDVLNSASGLAVAGVTTAKYYAYAKYFGLGAKGVQVISAGGKVAGALPMASALTTGVALETSAAVGTVGAGVGAVGTGALAAAAGVVLWPIAISVLSTVAISGIITLTKLLSVLSEVRGRSLADFNPDQSVYESWGEGKSLLQAAATAMIETRGVPGLEAEIAAACKGLDEEESQNVQGVFEKLSKGIFKINNKDNGEISGSTVSTGSLDGQIISSNIHKDDSAQIH